MSKMQPYGKGRAESKREIQRLLDEKGMNFMDVASLAGVSKQAVSATMNGYKHSPSVLQALRIMGIPEDLLHDPRNTNSAA